MNINFKIKVKLKSREGETERVFYKDMEIENHNYQKFGMELCSIDGYYFRKNINLTSEGMEIECNSIAVFEKFYDLVDDKFFNPFRQWEWKQNHYSIYEDLWNTWDNTSHFGLGKYEDTDIYKYNLTFEKWLGKKREVESWFRKSSLKFAGDEFIKMKKDLEEKANVKRAYYFDPKYKEDAIKKYVEHIEKLGSLGWVE